MSYELILQDGPDRSDRELARDKNYRAFLIAGNRIYQQGGRDAIVAAASHLGRKYNGASEAHFERLWFGLMPTPHTLN